MYETNYITKIIHTVTHDHTVHAPLPQTHIVLIKAASPTQLLHNSLAGPLLPLQLSSFLLNSASYGNITRPFHLSLRGGLATLSLLSSSSVSVKYFLLYHYLVIRTLTHPCCRPIAFLQTPLPQPPT